MTTRTRTVPKPIRYINKQAKKNFVEDINPARSLFSGELEDVIAYGFEPTIWSAPFIGETTELKKNGRPAYRCVYLILPDCVLVVHAFKKTAGGKDKKNSETVDQRLKAMDPNQFVD